jgi:hypothetical protein
MIQEREGEEQRVNSLRMAVTPTNTNHPLGKLTWKSFFCSQNDYINLIKKIDERKKYGSNELQVKGLDRETMQSIG